MKKIISLILATLFLFISVVSCSKNNPPETNNTSDTWEKEKSIIDSVEKKDYMGATFGFLTIGSSERYCKEILPNEDDGDDPIYAAVLKRNRQIEDYLNIKITETASADPINDAITCVISGDDTCDV